MSEWWTYRASDFLMYSPEIYWRLFGSLNEVFWPAQPLIALAVLSWLGLALRRSGDGRQSSCWPFRTAAVGLAVGWAVSGWFFLHQRLAPIYWIADYFAIAFVLQGVMLIALAGLGGLGGVHLTASVIRRRVGIAMMLWAVLGHPLLVAVAGSPWQQAQVLGLAADPTAIATLAFLLLASTRRAAHRRLLGVLWVLPTSWCLASAAMSWTMGAWQGWLMLIAVATACAALLAHFIRGSIPAPPQTRG